MDDNFSRKCIAIYLCKSVQGHDVVEIVDRLKKEYGQEPKRTQVDNGNEFMSKALDKRTNENKLTLGFSRPGKPTDNAYI